MNASQRLTLASVAFAAAAFADESQAQTLYGIDGNPPGPTPIVWEFTGPPDPMFCLYPNGPIVSSFPTVGGVICPGLTPFPWPFDGDVAVDPLADTVYAADPAVIAYYTSGGAFIDSFVSPIFVAGMGIDSFGPLIWITDGVTYGAVVPPPVPACLGPPAPFVIGPFPLPKGPGFFAGSVLDLDWDPSTGSLWGCDTAGIVGNFIPGPAPTPGPFGFFPVAPGPCPALTPMLTGIAVDTTMPGAGVFYVTDGMEVAYLMAIPFAPPMLAPPTFYTTTSCTPTLTPPLTGLDFAGHGITYGAPTSILPPGPVMGSTGHTYVGNPAFGVSVTWTPGALAALLFGGGGPACPAVGVGVMGYILSPYITVSTMIIPFSGTASLVLPIPPVLAAGTTVDLQWIGLDFMLPNYGASEALHATLHLP